MPGKFKHLHVTVAVLQRKYSNYYVNMKAKDIINQLLESKSIKAGPFAKEIGVHPTQIYDLQSEKIKKISASIASKIVNRYPEYDPIWLLTGEGEMLKSQPASLDLESKTNKTSAPYQIETKNINIDLHGEQIDSKRTIEVLIKVIETYQTRMDDLLNVIEVLKNENTELKEQLQKPNVS